MLEKQIKIVEDKNPENFRDTVNILLNKGWRVLSTNCTVINSEAYDFCSWYQAILFRDGQYVNIQS